jgi:hypothetical protein
MKKVKSKLHLAVIAVLALTFIGLGSCSKSNNNNSCTTCNITPAPPNSDSVATANLVAYFPFDGNANDTKGGLTATTNGVTFVAGIRGQAYQGAAGAYATLVPSAALDSLHSYSLSVWYNLPAQPTCCSPNDPNGIFFLFSTKGNPELIMEAEHYAPVALDSVLIHAGFYDPAVTVYPGWTIGTFDTAAIGKWVHFVMTYDGPSSTYINYQDGVPTQASTAYGLSLSTVLLQGPANASPASPPLGLISFASDIPAQIVIGTWPAGLYSVSPTLGQNGSYLGKLDELRIFNRALTGAEVAKLYSYGLAGN